MRSVGCSGSSWQNEDHAFGLISAWGDMNWTNTIALATGILGAIFGGISLWFSRQSAKASEISALAAQDSVNYQIAASRARNAANLVFVPALNSDVQTSYRADTDKLTIALALFNRGPADAHQVSLAVTSEQVTDTSPSILLLRPLEKRRFEVTVPLTDPKPGDEFRLPVCVRSTDRNGAHTWLAEIGLTCPSPNSLSARLILGDGPDAIGLAVE